MQIKEMEIAKIKIDPEDVIVISSDLVLDKDCIDEIKRKVHENFPDNRVMVLAAGLKMAVYSTMEKKSA